MRPNPKGLWHDHVDGSMAVADVIEEAYGIAKKPFPFRNMHMFLAHIRDRSLSIPDRFKPVLDAFQAEAALELLGYAYGKRRHDEKYTYVEGKFAPQYSTFEGLSIQRATEAMVRGFRQAEFEFGIVIYPHICIGREAPESTGIEVAKAALSLERAALDLACDENGNPPEKHLEAYRLTFGSHVKRDCHAGENESKSGGELEYRLRMLRNMLTAVFELRCHGIGHAIPLADTGDAAFLNLVTHMVEHGIRVAGCPLSNLEEGHIQDIEALGINELLSAGLLYTLNADDDLFLPPMSDVLDICERKHVFTKKQCAALEENVFRGAFDERVRT